MKEVTMNETLGEIVYEENVWTGKKSLTVNGETLEKTGKKTFRFADGRCTNVKGSMIFGTKMTVGNDTISISKPLTWYEYIIAIIIPAFVIIWGASSGTGSDIPHCRRRCRWRYQRFCHGRLHPHHETNRQARSENPDRLRILCGDPADLLSDSKRHVVASLSP